MTQAEVIISGVVLVVILLCAVILDRRAEDKEEGYTILSEEMFDKSDDVAELEADEREDASDDD